MPLQSGPGLLELVQKLAHMVVYQKPTNSIACKRQVKSHMQTGPPPVIKTGLSLLELPCSLSSWQVEVDFTKFTSDQFGFLSHCLRTG